MSMRSTPASWAPSGKRRHWKRSSATPRANCSMPPPRPGTTASTGSACALAAVFGDAQRLREEFNRTALGLFGSGWVWLVQHPGGQLGIQATRNAGTPLTGDSTPLLCCDVWEHAYYTDYQNARARSLDAFWQMVNWEFAESQLR
ncbi:hypothetical protein G6F22_018449 [Rhizopus arrhizus]|nr:hypothetical protein G6F22_018449 [Rhizopus arrhizus]